MFDTLLTGAAYVAGGVLLIFLVVVALITSILFRTVVETNKVHIVQSRRKSVSYGTSQAAGNVYYKWPRWFPLIGVTFLELPVNNFALSIDGYKAYDKDKTPLECDVTAFFRIKDTNVAAHRVENFEQLKEDLLEVVRGAIRKVLGSNDLEEILVGRSTFGDQFTEEVKSDLDNWGLEAVKNMELMDIRDVANSTVIANIMAKKISQIDMQSRVEVAKNKQAAEQAEIEANKAIDLNKQGAEQEVGERTAQKDKAVGIAREQSSQEVKAQQAVTAQKQVDVNRVEEIGKAEINKAKELVIAEQVKQTTVLKAEGELEATKLEAQGVQADGEAKAAAERAMQMAPVEAQIALAKEIGTNENYQSYLVSVEQIRAFISVGGKQAEALSKADVKIIATAGNASGGASSAMNLMSPTGGTSIASMLEGFAQAPEGRAILDAVAKSLGGGKKPTPPQLPPAAE